MCHLLKPTKAQPAPDKMLARSVLRATAKRAVRQTAIIATPITRSFNSSPKKGEPDVPIVSYQHGHRTEETLALQPSAPSGPVNPPGKDVPKIAVPLNPEVLPHLTPTLHRFTLPGKVVVITG